MNAFDCEALRGLVDPAGMFSFMNCSLLTDSLDSRPNHGVEFDEGTLTAAGEASLLIHFSASTEEFVKQNFLPRLQH